VPKTILEMDSMQKSVAPEMWIETSGVEKRSNHCGESAINAFDFAILIGAVVPSRFKGVTGGEKHLAKGFAGVKFTSLVDTDSAVALC
jgi:hypothetical protein